jgi:hypothetical protein
MTKMIHIPSTVVQDQNSHNNKKSKQTEIEPEDLKAKHSSQPIQQIKVATLLPLWLEC